MNLQDKYRKEIVPELKKQLRYNNDLAVPRLKKIVVNVGLGEALANKKVLEEVSKYLAIITGQKPIATKARRAISGFKLRAGNKIGLKVTLRRKRMYDFFEKLVLIVLPRLRDFRGVDPRQFDRRGNISIGFPEMTVFPEMDRQDIKRVSGMEIAIATSTDNDQEAKLLLEELGMPFKNEKGSVKG